MLEMTRLWAWQQKGWEFEPMKSRECLTRWWRAWRLLSQEQRSRGKTARKTKKWGWAKRRDSPV